MEIAKQADGTYTLTPSATEAAVLDELAVYDAERFAEQLEGLILMLGDEIQRSKMRRAMAKYTHLSETDKQRVDTILDESG